MTCVCFLTQAAKVKEELVKNVARLVERGRCLPSPTLAAPSASTDADLAALHVLVDEDLVSLCCALGCVGCRTLCCRVWSMLRDGMLSHACAAPWNPFICSC